MVASLGGRVGHAVDKVRLAHATWTVQEVEGQILVRSPHSANEGIIIDCMIILSKEVWMRNFRVTEFKNEREQLQMSRECREE